MLLSTLNYILTFSLFFIPSHYLWIYPPSSCPSLKPDIRVLQSYSNLQFKNQDHLPFGCLCWLKACISMGEKMLEWISRRPSPVYLLQAKMECVFQSVQYNVSSNNVKAKGCGREPLTTACLLNIKRKTQTFLNFLL